MAKVPDLRVREIFFSWGYKEGILLLSERGAQKNTKISPKIRKTLKMSGKTPKFQENPQIIEEKFQKIAF